MRTKHRFIPKLLLLGLSAGFVLVGTELWTGRVFAGPPEPPPAENASSEAPGLSHKVHIVVEEGDCTDCHKGTKLKGDRVCKSCHSGKVPKTSGIVNPARKLAARFNHERHVAAKGLTCETCHAATISDTQDTSEPLVTREGCETCHASKKVEIAEAHCGSCHESNLMKTRPADHDKLWMVRHGPQASWRDQGEHGRDCSSCHVESSCVSCHQSTTPRSHNGIWRLRTHGMAASWDREACKTCHETGSCVACHSRTQPLNHRGLWKVTHGATATARDSGSCTTCHRSSWCVACHTGER